MDIYDGADWTEMDIEDLKSEIEAGHSVEEAAEFLCRAGGVDDVARKCRELDLKPLAGNFPQAAPGRRTSNACSPKRPQGN